MLLSLLVFSVLLALSIPILVCIGVKGEPHSARRQIALQDTSWLLISGRCRRQVCSRTLLKILLKSLQQHFPVVDGQHAAGVLSRSELFASLELHAPETALAEIMRPALRR